MPIFPRQASYIDGRSVEMADAGTFRSINPANGEILAEIQPATPSAIERAVTSARRGQAA